MNGGSDSLACACIHCASKEYRVSSDLEVAG
jgi:hypothetical protein